MAEIQEVADRHRRSLRNNEAAALRQMNTAYTSIEKHLIARAQEILDSLDKATISQFFTLRRTKDLLIDIERLLQDHADNVLRPTVVALAENALLQAQNHGDELIRASLGRQTSLLAIDTLSAAQIAEIIAVTQSGPLARLLDGFGRVAAEKARRDLLLGVALGEHPSKVARRLRHSLNVTNSRAYLIARTEQLRAYREGTRQFYKNNSHIVEKWIWCASLSQRTCAACLALHGTEFDIEIPMASHPACRCSMIPKTKTWKELGFSNVKETRPTLQSGESWFANQSASVQRSVLGPKAHDAYSNGDVKLSDFIQIAQSREWGTTYRRGSLQNALK